MKPLEPVGHCRKSPINRQVFLLSRFSAAQKYRFAVANPCSPGLDKRLPYKGLDLLFPIASKMAPGMHRYETGMNCHGFVTRTIVFFSETRRTVRVAAQQRFISSQLPFASGGRAKARCTDHKMRRDELAFGAARCLVLGELERQGPRSLADALAALID